MLTRAPDTPCRDSPSTTPVSVPVCPRATPEANRVAEIARMVTRMAVRGIPVSGVGLPMARRLRASRQDGALAVCGRRMPGPTRALLEWLLRQLLERALHV